MFCSARGDSGVGGSGGTITEGHFRVSSPNFSNRRWEADYDPERVMSFGNVSARWGNDDEAVVSRIDGSVDSLDLIQLQDMRNWADAATDVEKAVFMPSSSPRAAQDHVIWGDKKLAARNPWIIWGKAR